MTLPISIAYTLRCLDLALLGRVAGQPMQMVEHYAKQVSQKKLAASAILKWENAPRTESVQRER
ncbi:MAG: hypothetical protein PVSMB1_08280 [Gemmatimonadaceae bacterium]